MKKIFVMIFFALMFQSCKESDGFYSKSANSLGGDSKDGGGFLPAPPDDGDDDNDGDDSGGGCQRDNQSCPKKIDSAKIKNGSLSLQSISCDDNKIAICHKKSSHESYEILFIDQSAINAHLDHNDGKDFAIDCSKINTSHKIIARFILDGLCNCRR